MDYVEAAVQLGEAIAESEEFIAYKAAESLLLTDEKATDLIQEYKDLQVRMVEGSKSDLPKDELQKIKEDLLAKQNELNEYPVTKAYFEGKKTFDNMMNTVNDVLERYLYSDPNCTGSCETCGGCH